MQEQSVLNVPASPSNGTSDLLSRLYREIGISAVAAALEAINGQGDRQLAPPLAITAPQPAAR